MQKIKHPKPWLVQLASGTKRNISKIIKDCSLNLNGLETIVDLNILPIGSYDVLIRMFWLEKHHFHSKLFRKYFKIY